MERHEASIPERGEFQDRASPSSRMLAYRNIAYRKGTLVRIEICFCAPYSARSVVGNTSGLIKGGWLPLEGSLKMINGSAGGQAGERVRAFVDAFTDFTVNRAAPSEPGTHFYATALCRERLLRCHARMPTLGRILANGITTAAIMAQSTRR